MKIFKRIVSLVIILIMLVSLTNIAVAAVGDSEENPVVYNQNDTVNFPQYPYPGYVRVDKKAEWIEGEDNVAKVTMALDGKGVSKTTDVVLVIDRSGSMNDSINIYKYKEVPLTFYATNVRYQYEKKAGSGKWNESTAAEVYISMTAYIDDTYKYVGYKRNSVEVGGFISTKGNYRLNNGSGTFSSWTTFDDNCLNALLNIFAGKTAQAEINDQIKTIIFPTNINNLKNTTNPIISSTTKISEAKEAAKKFVDALLPLDSPDTLNRIAVVSYSSNGYGKGTVYLDSILTKDNTSLKNSINLINATGGTHIQEGLRKATEVLNGSGADNKYIVVLTDGEPTFSSLATKSAAVTDDDLKYNYPSDVSRVLTEFNYDNNNVKGSGNSYTFSGYNVNGITVNNNGLPTISQALMAKKAGIEIYSIGFDVSNSANAKYTMEYVASKKDNFYLTTDDLSGVFANIAGRIAKAGTDSKINAAVTADDSVGYNFSILTDDKHPIKANQGTATAANNSISWNLGDITETKAELTYYIKLNITGSNEIPKDEMLNTGGIASVVYKNYNDKWVKKEFPVPQLSAGEGTINVKYYISDKEGNPVNNNGEKIPFNTRENIAGTGYSESSALGGTIITSSYVKPVKYYINQSTTARDESGNKLSDNINVSRTTIYLNFPYYPQPAFNVTYNGNGNTGGTVPVDNTKYYEGDTVTVLDKGTLEKTGYVFKGWSKTKNGNVDYIAGNSFAMENGLTLYAVWEKAEYTLKILYVDSTGIPLIANYEGKYAVGSEYSVTSPTISGLTPDRVTVSGTMAATDVTETVYYHTNNSTLKNHSMYKFVNKKPEPISSLNTIEKLKYTFGFKIKLGSKDLAIDLNADNGAQIDKDSFRLFDENNNEIKNYSDYMAISQAGSKFTIKFKDSMEENKDYTILYEVKKDITGAYNLKLDGGDKLTVEPLVNKSITATVSPMKDLE